MIILIYNDCRVYFATSYIQVTQMVKTNLMYLYMLLVSPIDKITDLINKHIIYNLRAYALKITYDSNERQFINKNRLT